VRGDRSTGSRRIGTQAEELSQVEESTSAATIIRSPGPSPTREKLSVNVNHEISERLRTLAYTHRLSESSIVEIALTMFFARGEDGMLGVLLKQLGATRRSKS
jgi:hypothetical protein